jgi:anaphase-promoting complex subunit 3
VRKVIETSSASSDDAPLGRRAASDAQRLREAIALCVDEAALAASTAAAHWSAVDCEIVDVLRTLGEAYGALRRHLGRKATWLLRPMGGENTTAWKDEGDRRRGGLAAYLRDTPTIRVLLAVAAREMGRYKEAETHFLFARRGDASMMAQMDVYSIVLFHLAREVSLSKLAMELSLLDADAPQTHIAIGNAFALQREHAAALRCFRRAALAAPEYAYAYALAGHEAKALAQHAKAAAFFRAALRADQRCWIAWAGLADVYCSAQQLDLAEYHWRMALAINSDNAVLWDLYGRVSGASRPQSPPTHPSHPKRWGGATCKWAHAQTSSRTTVPRSAQDLRRGETRLHSGTGH